MAVWVLSIGDAVKAVIIVELVAGVANTGEVLTGVLLVIRRFGSSGGFSASKRRCCAQA